MSHTRHSPAVRLIVGASAVLLLLGACAEEEPVAVDDPVEEEPEEVDDSAAPEFEIELQFASYVAEHAPQSQTFQWWASEVETRSGGRVSVEPFWAEALLSADDILYGVRDERAQIGYTANVYWPAELPLSQVAGVPFVSSNIEAQARVMAELYEENEVFRAEWENQGVHVLYFPPLSANVLGTVEPVQTVDDLEGLSIRGIGYINQALDAVGANPVAIASPEIYESLQRGLLDGYSGQAFENLVAHGLVEVAPYVYGTGLGVYAFDAVVISTSVWEELPEDVQSVLTEVSREMPAVMVEELMRVEAEVCDAILEAGGTVEMLPEAEIDAWREALGDRPIEEWAREVANAGVPEEEAKDFFELYVSLFDTYEAEAIYEPGVELCAVR